MKTLDYTKNLRVALFGAGKMGQQHMKAIEKMTHGRLVAVADPYIDNIDTLATQSELSLFENPTKLLKNAKPDVVHITTPPDTHADLAITALKNGAHVYVEKPFCLHQDQAENIFSVAALQGLKVCAGHQLLFEPATIKINRLLPAIGSIHHVESYFSFRQVRRNISRVDQLIDILPHPLYLLLHFLLLGKGPERSSINIQVDPSGELRAFLKKGNAIGTLIVSLNSRPIESYIRISGTNGSIWADYILGTFRYIPGPGDSAPSLLLKPYQEALQVASSTTKGVLNVLSRDTGSYPGLPQIINAFYNSILNGSPSPTSPESIMETVRFIEKAHRDLTNSQTEIESRHKKKFEQRLALEPRTDRKEQKVLVTGGTGFLGVRLINSLIKNNSAMVICLCRRIPSYAKRIPGIQYVEHDLIQPLPPSLAQGIDTIIHCAAETAGGLSAHRLNSVQATDNLLKFAGAHDIARFVHVSSVAVIRPGKNLLENVSENFPVDYDNFSRGPYVWGKAESEKMVAQYGQIGKVSTKIVRMAPLVDFKNYTPPGRLGRELGPLYVAVGRKTDSIALCNVSTAAAVLDLYYREFEKMPPILNLVDPNPPSRNELLLRTLATKPYLKAFWIPPIFLKSISPILYILQKIAFRSKNPVNVYSAFSSVKYDTSLATKILNMLDSNPG